MLNAQGVVYLSLKLGIRADLIRRSWKSVCLHDAKCRRWSERRYLAYAGFLSTTREVDRAPSFEIERHTVRSENGDVCRAFDSLAPGHSACGLPVYVARLPPAPFCETPP